MGPFWSQLKSVLPDFGGSPMSHLKEATPVAHLPATKTLTRKTKAHVYNL